MILVAEKFWVSIVGSYPHRLCTQDRRRGDSEINGRLSYFFLLNFIHPMYLPIHSGFFNTRIFLHQELKYQKLSGRVL